MMDFETILKILSPNPSRLDFMTIFVHKFRGCIFASMWTFMFIVMQLRSKSVSYITLKFFPARLRNVSQPCFTSCCIQFQEFGLNLQLPVVMRNDIVCLNAAVLPWQIWNCVARNTKWLLVVNQDYSYQYYEKCVLKCSSIAVTNLKLCGEKYEITPGRKSMCLIGRNPFGQTGGARVDKREGQLNLL